MPYDWEGNCKSGNTLSMLHRLQWFIHLWARGQQREMTTTHVPRWALSALAFCLTSLTGTIIIKNHAYDETDTLW